MDNNTYKTHEVKMLNREILSLTGIKKIDNFDDTEFYLDSVMGNIYVKGSNLEITLLDIDKGDVRIKGKINSIIYTDSKKNNKESILTKLFK
ncbi:MAG: sporulation protein YabP [Bacilli bacterium]|nr:sporulation protein YabP [Bacilli bacterium]